MPAYSTRSTRNTAVIMSSDEEPSSTCQETSAASTVNSQAEGGADRRYPLRTTKLISSEAVPSDGSSKSEKQRTNVRKRGRAKSEVSEIVVITSNDEEDDEPQRNVQLGKSTARNTRSVKSVQGRKTVVRIVDDSAGSEEEETKEDSGLKQSGMKLGPRKMVVDDSASSEDEKRKEKTEKKRNQKKLKRKQTVDDLVSSDDEKSQDGNEKKRSKKSRKRNNRKRICVKSSESDLSQDEKTSKGPHRKNIRKMMGKDEMMRTTINAQAVERERKKRVSQLQEKYNPAGATANDSTISAESHRIILETDEASGEVVEVHELLTKELKPHQVEGVRFLYTSTIESLNNLDQPPGGCILAHCMGLGKTLQVITFLHTILSTQRSGIRTALILAPVNVVLNWKYEFDRWLGDALYIRVWELTNMKTVNDRLSTVENWQVDGGVMIMGYDMFRSLGLGNHIRKEDARQRFKKALLDPGADIVVCDEGHILKNEKTGISQVANRVKTQRRICLTGTPLQNNLTEYHCMVQFVKPNLLGSKNEFKNRFENPIKNGQCMDSTERDVQLMKKRAHILHSLLDGCVHRRDYSALTAVLPPKQEYILCIRLSDKQIELYKAYLDNIVGDLNLESLRARKSLFTDFQILQRVWTHPLALYLHQVEVEQKEDDDNFVDNDDATPSCSSSESDGNVSDNGDKDDRESLEVVTRRRTRQNPGEEPGVSMLEKIGAPLENRAWWNKLLCEDDYSNSELSGKLVLLLEILKKCEEIGDKLLVFSQSLISLAIIERFLSLSGEDSDNSVSAASSSWRFGIDYFRMDGSTSAQLRKKYIERFNDPANLRARLFLISTKAGSLGTNLVGANRVIIFDASWNPSHDVQAIFRVYRYGQIKPVYIYRFIAQGTMEERIYDRQVTKQSLALRVVDEQQIERHFSTADLEELYKFESMDLKAKKELAVLAPPKDLLLKDVMFDKSDWFIAYHEHDSLLQHREDENLTEEEKLAAWNEYKAEREGRRPAAAVAAGADVTIIEQREGPLANCLQALPDIQQLITKGNQLIANSGETISMRLENVCEKWIVDEPNLALTPGVLVARLQELVNQVESIVQKRMAEQQRSGRQSMLDGWLPSSRSRTLFQSDAGTKYPPYGEPPKE